MAKNLVVIPTYNERENILKLAKEILNLNQDFHILIIDDNSPDGTGQVIDDLADEFNRVHVCHRSKKMGLGSAYLVGFGIALESRFDYIIEMDADFSHDPKNLPKFLEKFNEGYDVVIGSRYIKGGGVSNWSGDRKALSKYANIYARMVTGLPVKDTTGGFNGYRRSVLEAIDLSSVHSNGYAFQIEMKYRAWKGGFKLVEFPIVFSERKYGKSKMERRVIWEAFWIVWRLRLEK